MLLSNTTFQKKSVEKNQKTSQAKRTKKKSWKNRSANLFSFNATKNKNLVENSFVAQILNEFPQFKLISGASKKKKDVAATGRKLEKSDLMKNYDYDNHHHYYYRKILRVPISFQF